MSEGLRGPSVELRAALGDDSERLLAWANDPVTRSQSFSGRAIEPDEHAAWFAAALASSTRHLLIAEVDGAPVGMLRIDVAEGGQAAELSINVAPEHRGKGLSRSMLGAANEHAARLGLSELVAHVRPMNVASLAAFRRSGYEVVGDVRVKDTPAVRFRRRVP